jgi:hypothetical protein
MKRSSRLLCLLLLAVLSACGRLAARSQKSFDEIRDQVAGRTAAEVASLLGKPDDQQAILTDDERWIWWNYTTLQGNQYPPEERGQVVHLEITFTRPAGAQGDHALRVASPFGVSYTVPLGKN